MWLANRSANRSAMNPESASDYPLNLWISLATYDKVSQRNKFDFGQNSYKLWLKFSIEEQILFSYKGYELYQLSCCQSSFPILLGKYATLCNRSMEKIVHRT